MRRNGEEGSGPGRSPPVASELETPVALRSSELSTRSKSDERSAA